jgi:hypothetical protein
MTLLCYTFKFKELDNHSYSSSNKLNSTFPNQSIPCPIKEGILDPSKSSDVLIDLDSPDSVQSSTLSEFFQLDADNPSIPTQRETQW